MDVIKALEIISALSEGVNPETGEELSEDKLLQSAESH